MSPEARATSPQSWPILSAIQRRVLGVLMEKAKITPDGYPLSMNSLITGCNQKSSREPVMNLSQQDVEEALAGLQKHGLVMKITGSRVDRWRHNVYDAWGVDKVELALLAELLLRGPQTEGELRGRASRMEPIPDIDALRPMLRKLAECKLAIYLGEEGRRGTLITHGLHDPKELEEFRGALAALPPTSSAPALTPQPDSPDLRSQVARLQQGMQDLRAAVADLQEQLRELKSPK